MIFKSKIDSKKRFNMLSIFKKLFDLDCRNILIEGGNDLTNYLLKKRLFNKFYLFKSPKILSKLNEYKEFKGLDILKKNYKKESKIFSNLGNDRIILYKR